MPSKKLTKEKREELKAKKNSNSQSSLFLYITVLIIAIVVISVAFIFLMQNPEETNDNTDNIDDNNNGAANETSDETTYQNPIAYINTSKGTIVIDLYEDKTPNTVENFINYANDNFYNGLVFHRVANLDSNNPDDHIIQGGGFYPDGTKKETNNPIDLEIHPDARHVDGAIAMARTNDPNSATSQFYICDGPQSFLDDNYAVFGITVEGLDVVREIASVSTTTKDGMSNWPVDDVIINSITVVET
jgi:cyclophilin family peptidyl-prolyl cis-trans isomerase